MQPRKWFLSFFLALEGILYLLMLLSSGSCLPIYQFASIVLCFLYGLVNLPNKDIPFLLGAALTVGADFCLVLCDPIQQLGGMMFFLGVQACYAAGLWRIGRSKLLLMLRLILSAAVIAVTGLVLRAQTDALALVSMVYYVNLLLNLITAIVYRNSCKILIAAFILFLLCDTIIGLQVAAGVYLPISPTSLLHQLLFSGFPLAWFFYLPSQVLLAVHTKQRGRIA